jgi:hypothetical protein
MQDILRIRQTFIAILLLPLVLLALAIWMG